ncbi:MAG: hypothetical protein KGL39_39665 [Patescibacteria group bacterium]|nr:hypothetical protein [Patescibacteria group bacterium]
MLGTIHITKRLQRNPVWERMDYGYCWVDLLMLANDEDRETFIQGERIPLKRGQLAWSLRSLETRWKKSGEWVARYMNFLKDEGNVEIDSNRRRTIITILNYNAYNPLNTVSETVTETGTHTVSETEQKGEVGNGKWKGERADAPPPEDFPEIPDDKTVQCFCGDYRDLARGVDKGIGEVWWRGWLASQIGSRRPFPRRWQRALTAAFTADLVARHPKAISALSGDQQSSCLDPSGPAVGGAKKNRGPLADGRTVAQARFELQRELEQVRERLDACHETNVEPEAGDVRREKELRQALSQLETK